MRRSVLLPCLLAIGCRGGAPSQPAEPEAAVRIPAGIATEPERARPWSLRLSDAQLSVGALIPMGDGGVILAGTFEGSLTIPGFGTTHANGDSDVVRLALDPAGEVVDAQAFGSDGDDTLEALDDGLLSLRSWGRLELPGVTVEPPAPSHSYIPPVVGIVLDLSTDPPTLAARVPDAASLAAWRLPSGDVILAAHFDDGETRSFSRLERLAGGRALWTTEFENVEIDTVVASHDALWVATRGQRRLAVSRVDLSSGAKSSSTYEVRPGFDDLGSIVALAPSGDQAWGHTSGPPKDGMSHAALPFVATRDTFTPLLDATAFVLDADPGTGDVLLSVLHAGAIHDGPSVAEPGVYLLEAGSPRRIAESATRGALTPTHAVLVRDCDQALCVEAIPR